MRMREESITSSSILEIVTDAVGSSSSPKGDSLFWLSFQEFIAEKLQLCRPATVAKYRSLHRILKKFEEAKYSMTFEGVSKKWQTDFLLYCIGCGYLNNTTNKYIRMVQVFANWAHGMNYHRSLDFKRIRCEHETTEPIFLIMEELKCIEDFDVQENVALLHSKNIFLIGCYTSQRISDLLAMKKKDLSTDANGEMWWNVYQAKGRKLVKVYLVRRARKILEEYLIGKDSNDRIFPMLSAVAINRNLKTIGKGSGLLEIVTKVNYSGNNKREITQPKYLFLTTHVARKTAISLMCASNMPDHEIQSISGHSSSKEMTVYKGVDRRRIKESLAKLFQTERA
jgi:integrase